MNKTREKFFPLTTLFFLLMLGFFVNFSGTWNPFEKESWKPLVEDVKKAKEVTKKVDVALGRVREILEPSEAKIRGWTVQPTNNTKLHEFMWVCSHNSFSSSAHGYGIYRQQNMSMVNQLKAGVRALMLDTWVAKGEVRLTHGLPKYDKFLRPGSRTESMRFVNELKTIKKQFFDKNRHAVVFFILEDHVTDRELLNKSFEQSGLARKILQPSEWDPVAKKGWPTIGWMNGRGKQIIVFSDKPETKYIYPEFQHVIENNYGTIDVAEVILERSESKQFDKNKRYLYTFNFFTDFLKTNLNYSKINSCKLRNAINYAITEGPIIIRNRYPNFLAVDFVEQGDVFGIADEFNRKARIKKGKVFRVMTSGITKAFRVFTRDN